MDERKERAVVHIRTTAKQHKQVSQLCHLFGENRTQVYARAIEMLWAREHALVHTADGCPLCKEVA